MSWPGRAVVCDAGPLIHLDELAALDLLEGFSPIMVPDIVWQEVERHRPGALGQVDLPFERIANTQAPAVKLIARLAEALDLDAGEVAALTVMAGQPDAILLTDDSAARLAAESLHYSVHGTLGLLLRGLRRKQRTQQEILAILQDLPTRSTLHVAPRLLADIIEQVRQYVPQGAPS